MADDTQKNKDLTVLLRISDLVQSPFQARFDVISGSKDEPAEQKDIDELALSIQQTGLIQPITVRAIENGYEIIDGHRRVKAMQTIGRGQIMAIVKDVSDRDAQVMHVIGNLQRKNLKPIEQALTYQKMLDTGIFKDKRELSKAISKDETFIGDLISMLQLDTRIIDDLAKNNLIKDLRILRLLRLSAPVDKNGFSQEQWELYRKVLFSKMSRKDLAQHIKKQANNPAVKTWRMKSANKKITINLETGILDQAKREKLMKLIDEKMKEISDSL